MTWAKNGKKKFRGGKMVRPWLDRPDRRLLPCIWQVCIQPRPLAVNMALPAFGPERRAAALCYRSPVAGDLIVYQQYQQADGTDSE